MKFGIFSDVHGNCQALEAVLRFFEGEGVDQVVSLGDVVGYGADPEECVRLVRRHADVAVLGNHDSVAAGLETAEDFNELARTAIEWTRDHLSHDSRQWLASRPLVAEHHGVCFAHASISDPESWGYIAELEDAVFSLLSSDREFNFVGHTHWPLIAVQRGGAFLQRPIFVPVAVGMDERLLVNVGSVGQPRDRDPRACCCLFDTDTRTARIVRVSYDVRQAQARMRGLGVAEYLVRRIAFGR